MSDYEFLAARNLHVELGGRTILDDVSLRIAPRERVAVVGPNGAGKTTLLRALSGTVPIASGEVILCTEPLRNLSRATIARSIAVVGPDIAIPFATRADELVALGRLPHGSGRLGPTADDRERAAAALARVGAAHLAERDVRTLSAGERQLVLVALGLAQETPILALDEPTVHLDLRHRIEIVDLLLDLSTNVERTIIAIFHELDLVRDAFPRAILVADGRIVADGPPTEVLSADRVAAAWGIDPARARRLGAS
jgi:iron complex transport system ATP-binding protein